MTDLPTHAEQPHAPPPGLPDLHATKRFDLVDLQDLGPWLVERLRKRYPDQADRALLAYLRGWIGQNDSLFLRRGNAVALARVAHAPFLPCRVEEIFVLAQDDNRADAAALDEDILRWAEGLGAMEIVVERFTDVARTAIKSVTGRVRVREISFVPLGR